MITGMLWQCWTSKPLAEHAADAQRVYEIRHARAANCCHVHPDTLAAAGSPTEIAGMVVIPSRHTPRRSLWIGVDDELEPQPAAV